jgi:hypothetical protein
MAKPSFRYRAAIIRWLDAHARNQAVEYEEAEVSALHRPEECKILALVIEDNETGLSLYNEETGPSSIRGLNFIPRAMIQEVLYVSLTPTRDKRAKKIPKMVSPPAPVSSDNAAQG